MKDEALIKTGKDVRVVFRHFPLQSHDWAQQAAMGAACAQFQSEGAFWSLHDALFAQQSTISAPRATGRIREIAAQVPSIEQSTFRNCMDRQMSLGVVLRDKHLGQQIGISGTPSIFLNGRSILGISSANQFHQLLVEEIELTRSKNAGAHRLVVPYSALISHQ